MAATAENANVSGLGVVIGGTDPVRLIEWYRAALEPLGARWERHMLMVGPGAIIGFDQRDDVAERAVEPGRQLINITVHDIRAAEAHLNSLGVTWIRPVEEVGGGWYFSTVVDPDGNYLQILQGPDAP
ncbi:VOC family protein [Streptomyces sp. 3MP-14]|uniref:VOC family protein n=1 Tax=Streptomyces mimosae TaxID=2586635 RepID=A0A5N6A3H9_9ACTN|nr:MULTISPECIES: VOC family protein [Streptomyces]KAB8161938.1 VOC family protein [Streptomyces mimosae]KAB8173636.1 VOC family protein [Streptomyces sp. 3MP-14]